MLLYATVHEASWLHYFGVDDCNRGHYEYPELLRECYNPNLLYTICCLGLSAKARLARPIISRPMPRLAFFCMEGLD